MTKRTASFSSAMGSNLIGEMMIRVPQLAVDFWLMNLLTTMQFGVWVGLRTMLQFTTFLGSVPLAALDIQYGQKIGAGQLDEARSLAGSAFVGSGLFSLASLMALAFGSMIPEFRAWICPGANGAESTALVLVAFCQAFYLFLLTHVRNQLRFAEANAILVVGNLIYLALVAVLVPKWHVNGAMCAFGISQLFSVLAWTRLADLRFVSWRRQWIDCRELLICGSSLAIVGLMMTTLRLMTRPVIANELGVDALGIYGMATVFGGLAMFLGGSASRVAIQFAARAEGAQVSRDRQSLKFGLLPSLWIAAACCLAGTVLIIGAEVFLPIYSSRHEDVRLVLRPICLGAIVHSVATMLSSMYRAQSRQKELFWWTGGALIVQAGLLVTASVLDVPLWCYAMSDAVTLLAYIGLLVAGMNIARREQTRFFTTFGLIVAIGALSNEAVAWGCAAAGESVVMKLVLGSIIGLTANALWMPFAWQTLRRWNELSAEDLCNPTEQSDTVVGQMERLAA